MIDGFERLNDPEDPSPPAITQALPAETAAHGLLCNLASRLPTIINMRVSGQRSFARRILRMFQRRWALEHVDIRDGKILFEVKNPANREEDVKASQKSKRSRVKNQQSDFISASILEEPLS